VTADVSRICCAVLAALSFAPPPAAFAQDGRELVITATRIPTPAAEVASDIAVITRDEIERRQLRTLGEALQTLTGLSVVRSGGPGKTAAVFSRGTNANHTLVLIDGIQANDPSTTDGRTDFGGIDIADVDRIEVLYGSQGTLYGSDAIGAVIDIITRSGKGPLSGRAMFEGGSYGTFRQSAGVTGAAGRFDYAVNLQHARVAGLSATDARFTPPRATNDKDPSETTTLSTKLGLQATDALRFDLTARHVRAEDALDLNTSINQSDNDSHDRAENSFVRAAAKLATFGGAAEHALGVAYTRHDRLTIDSPDPINPFDSLRDAELGTRLKFDLKTDLRVLPAQIVTVGIETTEETADSNLVSQSLFGPFASSASASLRDSAAYVQDQLSLDGRWFGTLGARLDQHETFGRAFTWRVAAARLFPGSGTKLRGSAGTGFKAPTVFQLFATSISNFGVFRGNPDLQPERSRSWDAGIDQTLFGGRATLGIGYFETDVRNLIVGTATQNVNIGRAAISGFEVSASAELTDTIRANAAYTFLRARNATTGAELLRRPRHKATGAVTWRPDRDWQVTGDALFVGRRSDVDALTFATRRFSSYLVFGLAASYDLTANVSLFGRIDNVLDRDYEDPDGFVQPGRGVYVGARARF
jgi:vitamin B12 transporter